MPRKPRSLRIETEPMGYVYIAYVQTVGNEDIDLGNGATVVALAPSTGGQLDVVPLGASDDDPVLEKPGLAAGQMVCHGNDPKIPILVKTIKASSTVTSVEIGVYR